MGKLAKKPLKEQAKKVFHKLGMSTYFAETLIESLWRDDDEIVKEVITERIVENNQALAPVLASGFKESYLVDDITADTYTQLSSWFVLQPNELVGNFKAVVMVHDKVNNDIFTHQNVLTFDYTDSANEVEQDNAVVNTAPMTLALGIDANKQLYATLTLMHATDAKRIHFCFERCIVQSLMLDLAGTATMSLDTEGPMDTMLDLEGTAAMSLGMEGALEEEVQLDAGLLYNFAAIENEKQLAPAGWRVMTLTDATELLDYLGGQSIAGGKLKSTEDWEDPNTGATNSSGFTALPGGYRDNLGAFASLLSATKIWIDNR